MIHANCTITKNQVGKERKYTNIKKKSNLLHILVGVILVVTIHSVLTFWEFSPPKNMFNLTVYLEF